ncbi:hypothetical protein [Bradyrhizobium sp. HKCCYLRH1065]|uniref:hypothetical protein n=1 Tax=unclassified Bradyrhizobium TaxID=2631580 RepID=UPI003EC0DE2A
MRKFNPKATHPARAIQAWQILIGMAKNRQTTTYQGLSVLMFGKEAAGVLAQILGHIAFYCMDNDLPPLTSIVVDKGRGTPGHGFPIEAPSLDQRREQVYAYNWYDVYPPSEEELAVSYSNHQ